MQQCDVTLAMSCPRGERILRTSVGCRGDDFFFFRFEYSRLTRMFKPELSFRRTAGKLPLVCSGIT